MVSIVIYNEALETWDGTAFTTNYSRVDATLTNPDGSPTDWSYQFLPPAIGEHVFSALATDINGLQSLVEWRSFSVVGSLVAPETTTLSPANGSVHNWAQP